MRIKKLGLAVIFLATCNLSATTIVYTANLSGPNEFPVNASPGTGTAVVTIDDVANTMRVQATFSGLLGNTTAAHIHCCTVLPGFENAGVATQTPSFIGFPLGVTAGVFDNTFDMTLATTWNAPFIDAGNGGTPASAQAKLLAGLTAGKAYFNIHSEQFKGGEIRGFLVPEPATWGLVGLAMVGLMLLGRRHGLR